MLLVTHLYGCSKINLQLWGSSYLSNHSSWWILKFYVENLVTLGQIFELIECCCVYFEIKISFSVVLYLFRCLVPTRTLQLIIMVCSKLWSFDNSCFLWFEDWLFVTRTHLLSLKVPEQLRVSLILVSVLLNPWWISDFLEEGDLVLVEEEEVEVEEEENRYFINPYILLSVCNFSTLFSIQFLRCGQVEFV